MFLRACLVSQPRKTSRWEFQPRPTDRPKEWLSAAENTHTDFNCRGLGLLEMAYAITEKRAPRASGELAHHVLEVMLGIESAPDKGGFVDIEFMTFQIY